MKIERYIHENCVVVLDQKTKYRILKEVEEKGLMYQCKFFSMQELLRAYFKEGNLKTLVAILEKEKFTSYHLAEDIMKLLMYIPKKEYGVEKLDHLVSLKQSLIDEGVLEENTLLKNSLQHQKIVVIGNHFSRLEKRLIEELKLKNEVVIEQVDSEIGEISYQVYDTVEEELQSVLSSIVVLLEQGVDMNKIKLWVPNKEYRVQLHRFFSLFELPYHLVTRKKLSSYPIVRTYLDELSKRPDAMEAILHMEHVSKENEKVIDTLIRAYHDALYVGKETDLSMMRYLCETRVVPDVVVRNAILEIDGLEDAKEEDIVFALGVSMGCAPHTWKDDAYLSDEERELTDFEPSYEKNQLEKEKLIDVMKGVSHLSISFAKTSSRSEYAESPVVDLLKKEVNVKDGNQQYHYNTEHYNQYLLSHAWDQYRKFQEKTPDFEKLKEEVNSVYQTYRHEYQKIPEDKLQNYLGTLNLSYSTLQTFYQCQFRYYLNHILKLYDQTKPTTSVLLGTIVHEILERVLKENLKTYDDVMDEVFQKYLTDENKRSQFYQEKYRREIKELICLIQKQMEQTMFQTTGFEEKYELHFGEKIPVTLKGYIDKVLRLSIGNLDYVIVIDYKTGTIETNFNPVVHGLNMQLLIYYYLISETNENVRFAGSYWQNVIKDILPSEEGKSYDFIKENAYKWKGYTTENIDVAEKIDLDLEHSFIQSMKIKKDRTYYAYVKSLDDETLTKLLSIVKEKVRCAIKKILASDFSINPKKIGMETMRDMTGCRFCPYRDICAMDESDIVPLKEYKDLEFLEEVK